MITSVVFDVEAAKGAIRTAGALMTGNVFVAYFVFGNRSIASLGALFASGILTILLTSLKRRLP